MTTETLEFALGKEIKGGHWNEQKCLVVNAFDQGRIAGKKYEIKKVQF